MFNKKRGAPGSPTCCHGGLGVLASRGPAPKPFSGTGYLYNRGGPFPVPGLRCVSGWPKSIMANHSPTPAHASTGLPDSSADSQHRCPACAGVPTPLASAEGPPAPPQYCGGHGTSPWLKAAGKKITSRHLAAGSTPIVGATTQPGTPCRKTAGRLRRNRPGVSLRGWA